MHLVTLSLHLAHLVPGVGSPEVEKALVVEPLSVSERTELQNGILVEEMEDVRPALVRPQD